jgi:hypothetical protein
VHQSHAHTGSSLRGGWRCKQGAAGIHSVCLTVDCVILIIVWLESANAVSPTRARCCGSAMSCKQRSQLHCMTCRGKHQPQTPLHTDTEYATVPRDDAQDLMGHQLSVTIRRMHRCINKSCSLSFAAIELPPAAGAHATESKRKKLMRLIAKAQTKLHLQTRRTSSAVKPKCFMR